MCVFCSGGSPVRVGEQCGAPAGGQSRERAALGAGRAPGGRQGPLREGQRRLPPSLHGSAGLSPAMNSHRNVATATLGTDTFLCRMSLALFHKPPH